MNRSQSPNKPKFSKRRPQSATYVIDDQNYGLIPSGSSAAATMSPHGTTHNTAVLVPKRSARQQGKKAAQSNRHSEKLMKVILIGESSVGKTCIMTKYTSDEFNQSFISTIGVDFRSRSLQARGYDIKLQIWDTAGQERFCRVTSSYYRGAACCLVVFDLTNRESFNKVTHWLRSVDDHDASVQRVLVGNKLDLHPSTPHNSTNGDTDDWISDDEIRAFCRSWNNIAYYPVSAKTGQGIEQMFQDVVDKSVDQWFVGSDNPYSSSPSPYGLRLDGKSKRKTNKKCCK